MRNEKGQFIKGHKPLKEWIKGGYEKGHKPWNIGLKKPFTEEEIKAKPWLFNTERMKGNTNGFKKGNIGYWTGKKRPEMVGNTNGFKVGNKVNSGRSQDPWNKDKTAETDNRILTGENHWHWIEDRNKLQKDESRKSSAYGYWRKQVWARDLFKCRIANSDCNGRIEAHHILPWRKYPELRYEVNNGITLCHYHHPRTRKDEENFKEIYSHIIGLNFVLEKI